MPSSSVHSRKAAISARSAIPASTTPAVRSGSTFSPEPLREVTRARSSTCSPGVALSGTSTVKVAVRDCFAGIVPRTCFRPASHPSGTSSSTCTPGRALPGEPISTSTSTLPPVCTANCSLRSSSVVPSGSPPSTGRLAPPSAAVSPLVGSGNGVRESMRVNQAAGISAGSVVVGGKTCQPWVR